MNQTLLVASPIDLAPDAGFAVASIT